MITLHRLGQASLPVRLNCDLILTIEANPDTVVSLVTGARLVVSETPDQVVDAVREWRAEIARQTFGVPKIVEPEAYHFEPREPREPSEPAKPVTPAPGGTSRPRPGGLHQV